MLQRWRLLLNDSSAAGYYQPAFSMIRDLVETAFLLDLFKREHGKISEWRSLPARDRERRFAPVRVRQRLDELDGFNEARRASAYKLLSTYAAHPTPEGFTIISPEWMTQVGPFPDEKRLTAGLQELAKQLTHAAVVISRYADDIKPEVVAAKLRSLGVLKRWRTNYMPGMQAAQDDNEQSIQPE